MRLIDVDPMREEVLHNSFRHPLEGATRTANTRGMLGGWEGGLTMEEWLKEAISSIKGFAARAFEECAEKADEIHVQRNWAFELFAKEFARLAKEDDR